MITPSLPQDRATLIDKDLRVTLPYRKWMADGTKAIKDLQEAVALLQGGEAVIPVYSVVQGAGISVTGAGTADSPWIVALRPLSDSGVGAGLYKITRDTYGRVEGTEDAVLDDLSDVDAATPSDGDVLTWVDADSEWQALPAPAAIVTSVNGATGAVVLDDGDVKSVVTALTSGTTVTVDCSLGRNFTLTLGHNVGTLTLSNLAGSGYATEIELEIKQPSSGGPYTFALPASFKALGGSDTAIASAANAVTVLSAKTFDNGTTWRYAMQESA